MDQDDPEAKIEDPKFDGTVKRGSATCPCCGYTTPVARVREQLKKRQGGAHDARLFAVITTRATEQGRFYRVPTERHLRAVDSAVVELKRRNKSHSGALSLVPDEKLDLRGIRHTWAMLYGLDNWGACFTPRQALSLTTLVKLTRSVRKRLEAHDDKVLARAVHTCLALAVDRQADFTSSIASWWSGGEKIQHTFARQALPMIWDFVEGNPWSDSTGCWSGAYEWGALLCEHGAQSKFEIGHAEQASATQHPLPSDSATVMFTEDAARPAGRSRAGLEE